MYDTLIEKVTVETLDLDFECYYDLASGKGFRVSSAEAYDAKKRKIPNGLQSERWGTDFGDENAFQERYSCKCKKYIGKMYAGKICEQCGSPVEYVEADVTTTGWIILDYNRKVISPIYAMKLSDALGKVDGNPVLDRILRSPYRSRERDDADLSEILREKEIAEMKIHPFIGKGMTWLREHFDEVLDYYEKRKPTKAAAFHELRVNKAKVFTSCIAVFSSILRIELPGAKDEKLFKMKVNTYFQSIIQTTNKINQYDLEDSQSEKVQIQIDKLLGSCQKEIEELFMAIFKIMDGKKGVIQSKVIGGRYDWCSRNIITPNSGSLRSDEIELPYIAALELFRYELTNMYAKQMGCSIAAANNQWKRAKVHYNATFYHLACKLIKEDGAYLYLLINRNPSINYGSFLAVHVLRIKEDFNDKSVTLSTAIIQTMNADFDGDQINLFRIFGLDLGKRFAKSLNPRTNLYVSRMDGRVNPKMLPMKDEIAAFWALNNV